MRQATPLVKNIDDVLLSLPGPAKLRTAIIARFGSLRAYAGLRGFWPEHLSGMFKGARYAGTIRDSIAGDLEIERSEVDELLSQGEEMM